MHTIISISLGGNIFAMFTINAHGNNVKTVNKIWHFVLNSDFFSISIYTEQLEYSIRVS